MHLSLIPAVAPVSQSVSQPASQSSALVHPSLSVSQSVSQSVQSRLLCSKSQQDALTIQPSDGHVRCALQHGRAWWPAGSWREGRYSLRVRPWSSLAGGPPPLSCAHSMFCPCNGYYPVATSSDIHPASCYRACQLLMRGLPSRTNLTVAAHHCGLKGRHLSDQLEPSREQQSMLSQCSSIQGAVPALHKYSRLGGRLPQETATPLSDPTSPLRHT